MRKKLLFLCTILFTFIICVSVLANGFVIKNDYSIQITKGADTYDFVLKDIENSVAYIDKIYMLAIYENEYEISECLFKTERGCHLSLVDMYISEEIGYVTLKDEDTDEEVILKVDLNQLFPEDYSFDEPIDLFQRVNSYETLMSWCPEEVSILKIKDKINKFSEAIKTDVKDEEIDEMFEECKEKDTFTIKGREVAQETENCKEELNGLLEKSLEGDIEYSNEDIVRECEIRDYFNERFNEETVETYDLSFFDGLFEERDKEFIDEIIFRYGQGIGNTIEDGELEHKTSEEEVSEHKIENDEGTIISKKVKIEEINEEISILISGNNIRYIDKTEVILDKSYEFSEDHNLNSDIEIFILELFEKILNFLNLG